jgi:hypothetical protein
MPKLRWYILLIIFLLMCGTRWYYTANKGLISNDYRRHYLAAKDIREGINPYLRDEAKFKYPLFNAILLAPLSLFDIGISQSLWFALGVVMILCIFSMTWEMVGGREVATSACGSKPHGAEALAAKAPSSKDSVPAWVWLLPIILSLRFFWINLKLGQINLLVFYFTVLGLYIIERRGMPFRGGAIIGMAGVLKYMPIFFLLYFVIKRRWRECAGMVTGVIVCFVLIPGIFLGPSRSIELQKEFIKQGTRRVDQMVGSAIVSGESLHTFVYSILTPIDVSPRISTEKARQVGSPMYINIVNLNRKQAQTIARIFCALILLATGWFLRPPEGRSLRRRSPRAGETRLPEIPPRWIWEYGLMFMVFLVISPEARKAQFLTTYIPSATVIMGYYTISALRRQSSGPAFAAASAELAASATSGGHSPRVKWFLVLFILSQALLIGTSRVAGESLERFLDAYDGIGWGALFLGLLMIPGVKIGQKVVAESSAEGTFAAKD